MTSIPPYIGFWYLAYRALEVSYWLTLALGVVSALFAVRVFVIFHDCGHGSFFKSMRANDILGTITGVLSYTPYYAWRHSHARHHATSGDLDRRGFGDVWTMTEEEYRAKSWSQRILYRLYRNPLVIFVAGPAFAFLVLSRFPFADCAGKPREERSVWVTNFSLLVIVLGLSFTVGVGAMLAVTLPITVLSGGIGVWLFYVQHQYENTYWERHENWDYFQAALYGSSFYKLPKVLQWFSGNIGFHHIHHLNPRIPNYNLEPCHQTIPVFQEVPPLTLRESVKSLHVRLYDEDRGRMVGFHNPLDQVSGTAS
ncbi:MAG: fatty acid desaturase [Dehalococcoidia bacterium]|nr:fatty acid desaturase [Dehalococcoidia bacterium]